MSNTIRHKSFGFIYLCFFNVVMSSYVLFVFFFFFFKQKTAYEILRSDWSSDVCSSDLEFMPLDADGHWMNDKVVGQDEIVDAVDAVYPLEQLLARGAAPADRFRYLDGGGTIGVIPTVTKPFCGDCDRVRLTAEGQFRTCLFATREFDLMTSMRAGESDDELAARIEAAVATKWAGHRINQVNFVRPGKSMSQIGG